MKKYVEPQVEIRCFYAIDIITYSNGKDNDTEDDNWFND